MGITQALNTAVTGLNVAETGIELIARNLANAETPGYTRKTLSQSVALRGSEATGVTVDAILRDVDSFLQTQVRNSNSVLSGLEVKEQFLTRVDQLFGTPGNSNALDTIFNDFSASLQTLITAPEDTVRREDLIGKAQTLSQQLRTLTEGVQDLRQLAEDSLFSAVNDLNDSLNQLDELNDQLAAEANSPPDLLDQRDRFIGEIGQYLEITTQIDSLGRATVFTKTGESLLQASPTVLEFDQKGDINATALYSTTDADRGVGTIVLRTASGLTIDLLASDSLDSGRIGELVNLRDTVLVETQAQLDEIAHSLALTFSNKSVTSTAAVVGAQTGFDIDLTGIQSGDVISLTATVNAGPTTTNYSIIRVDDATQLPLSNDVTPDPNDVVIGVSFAAGVGGAATTLNTALGTSITVSNPSGNVLRIIDDGATNATDIDALSAVLTTTATQDDGTQVPLFTDVTSLALPYSNSLDGGSQKLGFAGRIEVNPNIVNDNELLVRSTATSSIGDPDRPAELYQRLSENLFTFSPSSGIGQTDGPVSTTIAEFTQRVVNLQTSQAEIAQREFQSQSLVTSSLNDRYSQSVSVDVNQELTLLITLQNSFSANARVITVASELLDTLLRA
ncbi:MAG: flagellar hook-associated protein FlgK [Pseudomonadota bacterium]